MVKSEDNTESHDQALNSNNRHLKRSLLASILLEVAPLEADLLHVAVSCRNIALFLTVKAICLLLILLPFSTYFRANRWQDIVGRNRVLVLLIVVIVTLNLMMNVLVVFRMF